MSPPPPFRNRNEIKKYPSFPYSRSRRRRRRHWSLPRPGDNERVTTNYNRYIPPSLPPFPLAPPIDVPCTPFFFGLGLWRQLKNGNVVQLPIDHRLITDLNIWRLTEYSICRLNTKQLAWNHSPITTTISKQTKGSPKQTDYMFIPELLETEIKSRREDHSKISVLE